MWRRNSAGADPVNRGGATCAAPHPYLETICSPLRNPALLLQISVIMSSSRPAATTVLAAPLPVLFACGADLALLSAEEQARIAGLRQPADRQRSIAAHWLKRQALARMTGEAAAALSFASDAQGKPHLHAPRAPAFNISHAGDWVALALGWQPALGVDVEAARSDAVWADVLPAIRAPEDAAVSGLHLWTAKEAVLKQQGSGFLGDPQQIVIAARHARGFVARTPLGSVRGAWRVADASHLLAAAGPAPILWRLCTEVGQLRRALAALR